MSGASITRRGFIAQGGALCVGFSLAQMPAGAARAAPPAGGEMDVDAWLTVAGWSSGPSQPLVTIFASKVELGTGVTTALMQLVAEELNVSPEQVACVQGDTALTPGSQGYTAGSKSLQNDGPPMRNAAATAMQALMALASAQLGVPAGELRARGGVIGVGESLQRGKRYDQLIDRNVYTLASATDVATKPPSAYTLVGTPQPRTELPDKFTARFRYVSDLRLPGMLHARVLRPAGRNARLLGLDATAAAAVPGFVRVVQQGNFAAVVASDEYAAVRAAELVVVNWSSGAPFIAQAGLPAALQDPANVYATGNEVDLGNVDVALTGAGAQLAATYFTPFQMHGAMAPSCAVADVAGGQATVWSSTQGPYPLRAALAPLLGLPQASIRVIYAEGSGCFGHNGADDVAAEAALISKLAGAPVRLQWTRGEEHRWEPLGPAMLHRMRGGVSGARVVAWEHGLYSPTHNTRPSGSAAGNLLPAQQALQLAPADAPPLNTNAASRNGPVTYDFANNRLVRHWVKSFQLQPGTLKAAAPLTWVLPRSTALRGLGGFSNSFANESFMDELARLAGADPLAFRLAHLSDPRAIATLQAAAAAAGWGRPLAAAPAGMAAGRGIAYQRYETVEAYVATVVELRVNLASGEIRVDRVVVAHDCGQVVNPDGLRNQIEGNVLQGISRTLKEQVDYAGDAVLQSAWVDNPAIGQRGYPVIRFDEIPAIETVLLNQPGEKIWGAGEAAIGCLPGAIGNAVFQATGVRLRSLPMRPETVRAALAAAGAQRRVAVQPR